MSDPAPETDPYAWMEPDHPADPLEQLVGFEPPANRLGFVPFEDRWDGDGPMPMARDLWRGLLPDLVQMHPRRWAEAMTPYSAADRVAIAQCQGMTGQEAMVAEAIRRRLPRPAQTIAREAVRARSVPEAPELAAPRRAPAEKRRPCRQVNVRVSLEEYEEIVVAADIAGTTPTTLARWLLLAGTRRVVRDHAAAYAEARSVS